jgi:hypothetical protein
MLSRANLITMARLGVILLLQDYEIVFAIVFLLFNAEMLRKQILSWKNERNHFIKGCFDFYMAHQVTESICFLNFSVVALDSQWVDIFSRMIEYEILTWIGLSLLFSLILVFAPNYHKK